jgi:hypothetical protein
LSKPARFLIFFSIVNEPLPRRRRVPRDDDRAIVRDPHCPHLGLAGGSRVDLVFQLDPAVIVLGLQFEMTAIVQAPLLADAVAASSSRSECWLWP